MSRPDGSEPKQIVSIDFGTYGFLAAHATPANIEGTARVVPEWPGRPDEIRYEKVLNAILLSKSNPNHVYAYGWEARDMYMEARDEKSEAFEDMAYIDNFKLQLLQEDEFDFDANRRIQSKDGAFSRGLCPLVSQCLKQIVDHSVSYYNRRIGPLKRNEIYFILSVPVSWTEQSVEAMKQCFDHIDDSALIGSDDRAASDVRPDDERVTRDNLLIVTEPEAAGNYLIWGTEVGRALRARSKFMILDCGSGTFDLVAQEVVGDGASRQLRDIRHSDGKLFGALNIDNAFEAMLGRIFGEESMNTFRAEYPAELVEQMMWFQGVRERVQWLDASSNVPISSSLIDIALENGVDFAENAQNLDINGRNGVLQVKRRSQNTKLVIDRHAWRFLHKEVLEAIVEKTCEMLEECDGIEYLFLVGGFSQSSYVQTTIRRLLDGDEGDEAYPHIQLVNCPRPQVAVTMGSLWAAHQRVASRKLRVSYGVAVDREYRRGDPEDHKVADPNFPAFKTRDCFDLLWARGDDYKVGSQRERVFPLSPGQKDIEIVLYRSTDDVTDFVDEPCCTKAVTWTYDIEPSYVSLHEQKLHVCFKFGEDCLHCGVYVEDTSCDDRSSKLKKFLMRFEVEWD